MRKTEFVSSNSWSNISLIFFSALCVFSFSSCGSPVGKLSSREGSFDYSVSGSSKLIRVWYYKPDGFTTNSKIVFVMHGVKRDGKRYLDEWKTYANDANSLLIVPEFSKEQFAGSRSYNLGNMFTKSGETVAKKQWSFTAVEEIFDYVKVQTQSKERSYNIYGHSAGAQFVHRLITFLPNCRVNIAIAANAGWYTNPKFSIDFPYGLRGTSVSSYDLNLIFKKRFIVLLGENDTNSKSKYLRKTEEAQMQGKNRFERGYHYFREAKLQSKSFGYDFNWSFETVPGVGHNNSEMAVAASEFLK